MSYGNVHILLCSLSAQKADDKSQWAMIGESKARENY